MLSVTTPTDYFSSLQLLAARHCCRHAAAASSARCGNITYCDSAVDSCAFAPCPLVTPVPVGASRTGDMVPCGVAACG